MNLIVKKKQFSEKVFLFEVEAPLIAKSRKAGNFVIIRIGNKGERMPLTIADADVEKGTITIVVQKVGLSSQKLCSLNEGDYITDVVGPLGNPTHIENFGTVVCAGGDVLSEEQLLNGHGIGLGGFQKLLHIVIDDLQPPGKFRVGGRGNGSAAQQPAGASLSLHNPKARDAVARVDAENAHYRPPPAICSSCQITNRSMTTTPTLAAQTCQAGRGV